MLEYLNFCLLCVPFSLIFYLYIRTEKYFPLLKMAEDIFSSYGAAMQPRALWAHDSNQQSIKFEILIKVFCSSVDQKHTQQGKLVRNFFEVG